MAGLGLDGSGSRQQIPVQRCLALGFPNRQTVISVVRLRAGLQPGKAGNLVKRRCGQGHEAAGNLRADCGNPAYHAGWPVFPAEHLGNIAGGNLCDSPV